MKIDAETESRLQEKYLKNQGNHCPFCGSADFDIDPLEGPDCSQVWQRVKCESCGASWNDVYSLSMMGEIKPGSVVP